MKSYLRKIQILLLALMLAVTTLQGQVKESLYRENKPWVDSLLSAYQYFQSQKNITAADKLYQAAELMPTKNWEVYMIAATVYGAFEQFDKGFLSIDRALDSGMNDLNLLNSLPDLSPFRESPRWSSVLEKAERIEKAEKSKIQKPELLAELMEMWRSDQASLAKYNEELKRLGKELTVAEQRNLFKEVEKIWDDNKVRLEEIISEYGWPGFKLVGKEGEKISWAIPQHHPDVFFKRRCLDLLKKSVEEGDADPNHYAELHDRIARETWVKQKYGASMGSGKPYPISNPSKVNVRRERLNLADPIEVYAMYHGIEYRTPSKTKADQDSIQAFNMAKAKLAVFYNQINDDRAIAINNLKDAIQAFGSLSNEELFYASQTLVSTNQEEAIDLGLRILRVLVWREWPGLNVTLSSPIFKHLEDNKDWLELKEMISVLYK